MAMKELGYTSRWKAAPGVLSTPVGWSESIRIRSAIRVPAGCCLVVLTGRINFNFSTELGTTRAKSAIR